MTKEEILDVISRAKYKVIDGEVKCTNVEYTRKTYLSWNRTAFPTWDIKDNIYRIIEEPEMIPLDFSDILDIMGKWLVDTRDNIKCYIEDYKYYDEYRRIRIKYEQKWIIVSFQDLQEHFIFKDTGKRLEKEKK